MKYVLEDNGLRLRNIDHGCIQKDKAYYSKRYSGHYATTL
jgi:hypothetical protein